MILRKFASFSPRFFNFENDDVTFEIFGIFQIKHSYGRIYASMEDRSQEALV